MRYRHLLSAALLWTSAAVLVAQNPNGGVWKTDDFGRTWAPIFDQAPTGSVGDVAVSPSHPDVLYVGSGEGLHRPDLGVGDGVFTSQDGGRSWTHVGLSDVQQVGRIIVHPTNPAMVFVAGMGHPYGPNEERGVFRTTDAGRTWEKVLYVDRNTGASQVEFDPVQPRTVYAALWEHREGPWENGSFSGPHSGLFKSTDGGTRWHPLTHGLPTAGQGSGRIIFDIARSDPTRLYALVSARDHSGVYRSDDAGEHWQRVSTDSRLGADIRVHPGNPDVVFSAGTASYRSDDGGRTWTSIKGAPGGDDYQRFWINPLQPEIMVFTADQGATITTNGGRTWSSWYNQPTAQLYHVATDNQFPYWIYGGQQESGAIGIASRGNGGQISLRDWMGVGADEYAYVAPDPLNPDIVYGGRVQRFNKKTGQYRMLRTMPLLFHPADPKTLFFATNVLWKTTSGGERWAIVSPVIVGTHGRSIWILDNIAPLRELAVAARAERAHLFGPPEATRVRGNMFSDTPLPPEEPTGQNPPDGAIIDYYLARPASDVAIEVVDNSSNVLRRFSNSDKAEPIDPATLPYPTHWFRPPQRVVTQAGHHRVIWDLRYEPPRGTHRQFSIAATYRNTPSGPNGPYVHPGRYRVRLTVDGMVVERPIDVRMDPRVTLSADDLQLQTDLSLACYRGYLRAQDVRDAIDGALQEPASGANAARRSEWQTLCGSGIPGDPDVLYGSITAEPEGEETVVGLQHKFLFMLNLLQQADARPTSQAREAVPALQKALAALEKRWQARGVL